MVRPAPEETAPSPEESVEESNVDLSTEFSTMIVAQQNYEANAKVLTTLNQVSQATIQMV